MTRKAVQREAERKEQKMRNIILIVDDIEMNRAILSHAFKKDSDEKLEAENRKDSYEILEAENGQEALELIKEKEKEIAAILLDVVMPVMDGFGLLQYMKENQLGQEIPVFLITADASPENMQKGFDYGVKDIIQKPFVPHFIRQRINGVIELYTTQERLKETVEHQAAIIEAKVEEVSKVSRSVIEILALAIEFRSRETGLHVQNIHDLTKSLLKRLREKKFPDCSFTDEEIELIATASMLHDVGKIAVPDHILNKPGRLTAEEFQIMKQHSLTGAQMLERMTGIQENPVFSYAYDICRHHHERWDGSGYPDGLKGNENSISAQVVALADVFDALTHKRCYKPAFSKEEAVRMIVNGECGAFNPLLIEAFLDIQEQI